MSERTKLVHLHLTFRNCEATDALKNYATEKITHCLQKFIHQDTEANMVLSVEKNTQAAELSFRSDGADFNAKQESGDLYASIDAIVDVITKQLRRHKDKNLRHHS